MKKVAVQALQPGAVIMQPVKNHQGLIIINKGTVITGSLIEKLQTWDIAEVWVEITDISKPAIAEAVQTPQQNKEKDAHIKKTFEYVKKTDFVKELMEAVRRHMANEN